MAFPTYVGSTFGQVQASSATWTLSWSNVLVAGDVVLLGAARDGSGDMTLSDAGFSSFVSQTNGSAMRGEVWYKISTGLETGVTVNVSGGERGSWHLRQYTLASSTPTASSTNGNSSTLDPPSHTAATAEDHTWIIFEMHDESTAEPTIPAGYGNVVANPMSTGSGAGIVSADQQISSSQTHDPGAFSLPTAEQWGTFTIALAAAGGAPPAAVVMVHPPVTMMGFGG